ncbi:MAG: helix-turn-helix transcriptional regulator [Bacteroidia bacterium]|nr:helix-turn-helix transcriptional regulator [Bacteroidia bacterium]
MNQPTALDNIQSVFLGQIRDRLPENVALADELAELLNVSRDSAYRRIRGETVLSLDEVKKLYDQYGVSVDAIISPSSNMVLIQHQAVDFNYSLEEWLKSLIQNLELAKSSKNPELTFAAKDIPIFHYFRFPQLSSFKLFVWLKSVIKDPRFANLSYKPDVLPKEILAGVEKAWQLYASLPSTEIWSDEVINGTLKQIEFYRECDYFTDRNMAGQLYDQMLEFINLIREEASAGKKSEGGSFTLYQNEIFIPDNTILANIHNQRMVYINYNTTDLLTTQQGPFCEKTEDFMINLIKNSALISATAEKERNKFFNKLESRILISKAKPG